MEEFRDFIRIQNLQKELSKAVELKNLLLEENRRLIKIINNKDRIINQQNSKLRLSRKVWYEW